MVVGFCLGWDLCWVVLGCVGFRVGMCSKGFGWLACSLQAPPGRPGIAMSSVRYWKVFWL